MRRWTVTLFLMIGAAGAAILAPRLLQHVALPLPVQAAEVPHAQHVEPVPQALPNVVFREPREPQAPPVIPSPPQVRRPPPPTRPKARSVASEPLIPELDERPDIDWTQVPPPTVPAPDPSFWRDCPGCGMG